MIGVEMENPQGHILALTGSSVSFADSCSMNNRACLSHSWRESLPISESTWWNEFLWELTEGITDGACIFHTRRIDTLRTPVGQSTSLSNIQLGDNVVVGR